MVEVASTHKRTACSSFSEVLMSRLISCGGGEGGSGYEILFNVLSTPVRVLDQPRGTLAFPALCVCVCACALVRVYACACVRMCAASVRVIDLGGRERLSTSGFWLHSG